MAAVEDMFDRRCRGTQHCQVRGGLPGVVPLVSVPRPAKLSAGMRPRRDIGRHVAGQRDQAVARPLHQRAARYAIATPCENPA